MQAQGTRPKESRTRHWAGGLGLVLAHWLILTSGTVLGQGAPGTSGPAAVQLSFAADPLPSEPRPAANPPVDAALQPTSCPSCGTNGGVLGLPAPGGVPPPGSNVTMPPPHQELFSRPCCGFQGCYPGRKPCCHPAGHDHTFVGRFFSSLYDCLCCTDPCYEGKWIPLADSAFFAEAPRPITQQRLRWDAGVHMIFPDRAEYFWARADGRGRGPRPQAPFLAVPRLRYHEMSLYTEAAVGTLGIIVNTPYRSVDPDYAPHAAGFSDMDIATKTLIFDCELLQVAFIMRTFLPVGSPGKGLGTGHVSLEPSLVWAIKMTPDCYCQGQVAQWIPLGGDPNYAGAILHYHFALNHTLVRLLPEVPLIGTLEFNGWSFQEGQFTDFYRGPFQKAGNETYINLGFGLRMFVCDRIDVGFGMHTAVTDDHFANALYRFEFRWRY